jgi:hypothetical protein
MNRMEQGIKKYLGETQLSQIVAIVATQCSFRPRYKACCTCKADIQGRLSGFMFGFM